jgi:hypothetical protein
LSRQIPFGRLAAEFVVIVVGVLVALAADDWRQRLRDREAEVAALMSVQREIEIVQSQYASRLERYEARRAGLEDLLAIQVDWRAIDPDSIDALLRRTTGAGSVDPADGAMNSLLGSGQLQLISNIELRENLGSWPSELANFKEVEERYGRIVMEQLRPLLRENRALPSHIEVTELHPNPYEPNYDGVFVDPRFAQLLIELHAYTGVAHANGSNVQNLATEILEQIESELSR